MNNPLNKLQDLHECALGAMRPQLDLASEQPRLFRNTKGQPYVEIDTDFVVDGAVVEAARKVAKTYGRVDKHLLDNALHTGQHQITLYFDPDISDEDCARQILGFLRYWGQRVETIRIGKARTTCAPNSQFNNKQTKAAAKYEEENPRYSLLTGLSR